MADSGSPTSFATVWSNECGATCCGNDDPSPFVSTCDATIAGISGCTQADGSAVNGTITLQYQGTGVLQFCPGDSVFPAGTGKWVWAGTPPSETEAAASAVLIHTCEDDGTITLDFWYSTGCDGDPDNLSTELIHWQLTGVAGGSCDFDGSILANVSTEAPCTSTSSTVTISGTIL